MLMRFDPFRDVERWAHQLSGGTRQALMSMDAYRQGEHWVAAFDLPGVDPGSIDVTVENNVLTVKAERSWQPQEGEQIVVSERPQGTFTRQLYLGEGLDVEHIAASYGAGGPHRPPARGRAGQAPEGGRHHRRRSAGPGGRRPGRLSSRARRGCFPPWPRRAPQALARIPKEVEKMVLPVRQQHHEPVKWEGFPGLSELRSQLDSLFSGWDDLVSRAGAFTPLADVEETDEAYVAEIELPGVALEDVSLEVAGGRLTVTGERKEKERVGILRRRTRTVGRFHYEVFLPGEVDEEGVEAALKDGVLTVRAPKPASQRPRRIPVTREPSK